MAWEPLHLEARYLISTGDFKGTEEQYIERFAKLMWKPVPGQTTRRKPAGARKRATGAAPQR